MLRKLLLVAAAFFVIASCNAQTAKTSCAAERYSLIPLPLNPTHISDTGFVSGTTPDHAAALWTEKAGLIKAPIPSGYARAEGISVDAHGLLIGAAMTPDSSQRQAFTFYQGKLDLLEGKPSRPSAVNDSGMVVGEAVLPENETKSGPVLWRSGSAISLATCCGGTAIAIDDQGIVVGEAYDLQGKYYPFQWTTGSVLTRIAGTADNSSVVALNNRGAILIQSPKTISLYKAGTLTPIPLSSKYPSQPKAVNDCGAIVGAFGPFSDAYRAFVWDPAEGFRDLNDLVSAPGWKLEMATSVNNRGEIVGFGDRTGDEDQGFLLVPPAK
jgi:uncharacterized membrane protein